MTKKREIKKIKDQVIRLRATKAFKNEVKKYADDNKMTISEVIELALTRLIK
ncbi:MAG: hypothetical protein KAU90_09065 [Sulfurovaceae bacterium]|nr:hypothetical protein [Sulfurovaceae bacterium]